MFSIAKITYIRKSELDYSIHLLDICHYNMDDNRIKQHLYVVKHLIIRMSVVLHKVTVTTINISTFILL